MQHQGQTLPSSLALALAAATAATGGISSGEEKPEAYRDPNK
jgi:hypothetical protein